MVRYREWYRKALCPDNGIRPPNIDTGPLEATWERWKTEGLRLDLTPYDYDAWCEAFGWEKWPLSVSLSVPRQALYKEEILEEDETTVVKRMPDGSVIHDGKTAHKSIYHVIRPAVTNRKEWLRLKAWMDVEASLPTPATPWAADPFRKAKESDRPVALMAGSLMGEPRNWLGFEEFAVKQIEEPDLVEDMVEASCRVAEWRIRAFGDNKVPLDVVHFWEDICFKNGPIVHPDFFRRVVVPRYRRIADLCKRYGYPFVSVDSDGNLWALLDGWIDGGVNLINPFEVQAGMDVNEVQAKYGGCLAMSGGIHKYRLTEGESAIAEELERILPAVEKGGYIPMLDHNVPSDVPFKNYLAYCRLKHEILGLGNPFDPVRVCL